MTRRDYIELAADFKIDLEQAHNADYAFGIAQAIRTVATALKRNNSAFQYVRFFEACGLNEWGEIGE